MANIRVDQSLLEAALIGLQHRHTELEEKIATIRRQLGTRGTATVGAGLKAVTGRRGRISAAARARIAAAQRKRWAAYRRRERAY